MVDCGWGLHSSVKREEEEAGKGVEEEEESFPNKDTLPLRYPASMPVLHQS